MITKEKINFLTKDSVEIIGDFYSAENRKNAILLLHMMPAVKESWQNFAEKMQKNGFPSLAIDLRGHGESIRQNSIILNYKDFKDEEHQKNILDVVAATEFLQEKGVKNLILCGGSIGANLSLKFIAENPDKASAAILLSPGINYKGIEAIPLAKKIKKEHHIFIAAAKDDVRSNGATADEMADIIFDHLKTEQKKRKIFETGGHGTDLFISHPEFEDELTEWILNIKK